jgi:hypothetical protein
LCNSDPEYKNILAKQTGFNIAGSWLRHHSTASLYIVPLLCLLIKSWRRVVYLLRVDYNYQYTVIPECETARHCRLLT